MEFYHDIDLLTVGELLNSRIQNVTSSQRIQMAQTLNDLNTGLVIYDIEETELYIWEQTHFKLINENDLHTYIYEQAIPSSEWDIVHPLNKIPSVTVLDSASSIIEGSVRVLSNSRIIINFSAPFSGIAVLN